MVKAAVSRGQALEVAARVATQTRWEELDGDNLQELINLSPKEFGNRFTAFLKGNARMTAVDVQPAVQKRIRPPKGARIHILKVRATLNEEWHEAINAGGPDTPDYYNIRKVGDQYPPTGTAQVNEEYILLNYPSGDGGWDKAHAWAKAKGLKKTDQRRVLAVGREHPALHTQLGCSPLYVVATTKCFFEGRRGACCVWWFGSKRGEGLLEVGFFDSLFVWFAFRK